jgi:hypothetical protein
MRVLSLFVRVVACILYANLVVIARLFLASKKPTSFSLFADVNCSFSGVIDIKRLLHRVIFQKFGTITAVILPFTIHHQGVDQYLVKLFYVLVDFFESLLFIFVLVRLLTEHLEIIFSQLGRNTLVVGYIAVNLHHKFVPFGVWRGFSCSIAYVSSTGRRITTSSCNCCVVSHDIPVKMLSIVGLLPKITTTVLVIIVALQSLGRL